MRRRRHRGQHEPPPADSDRLLAEEVFYLHSLWRRGPHVFAPAPAPIPPRGSGSLATRRCPRGAGRWSRRRLEHPRAQEQDPGSEWPIAPSPPASPTTPWPVWSAEVSPSPAPAAPHPPPLRHAHPSPGSLSQRAAEEFFSKRGSDDDGEGSESEGEEDLAMGFFMGLFERDAALRLHYERTWEEGEFMCMACAGRKARKGKTRKFRGCVGLVQHAQGATRCGRPGAHRALAAVICRVLGWDISRLPSVVIDPRGTLGQTLATEAAGAVAAQEENVDAEKEDGSSGNEDAAKEGVSTGKNDGSLSGMDAMEENVNVGRTAK